MHGSPRGAGLSIAHSCRMLPAVSHGARERCSWPGPQPACRVLAAGVTAASVASAAAVGMQRALPVQPAGAALTEQAQARESSVSAPAGEQCRTSGTTSVPLGRLGKEIEGGATQGAYAFSQTPWLQALLLVMGRDRAAAASGRRMDRCKFAQLVCPSPEFCKPALESL